MNIEYFKIKNFRSLKDLEVNKFGETTVFFGDNNAGKSNILAALFYIFKRKPQFREENQNLTDPINFYQGNLGDFSNNYYKNENNPIEFLVKLSVNSEEIEIHKKVLNRLISAKKPEKYVIDFEGVIRRAEKNKSSELFIKNVNINNKNIFTQNLNEIHYFPTLDNKKMKQAEYAEMFENFTEPFNDCFSLIGRSRDMLNCKFGSTKNDYKEITPENFKDYLYSLYLSEDKYHIFEKINDIFKKQPYNFGEISFSHIDDQLEIMIKEKEIRLPINHIGSGVLQSLYLITFIIATNTKIIGIEELEQNLSPERQELTLIHIHSLIKEKILDQIILSSHSVVYSKIELANIIYLIKKDGYNTVLSSTLIDNTFDDNFREHFKSASERYTSKELNEHFKKLDEEAEKAFKR